MDPNGTTAKPPGFHVKPVGASRTSGATGCREAKGCQDEYQRRYGVEPNPHLVLRKPLRVAEQACTLEPSRQDRCDEQPWAPLGNILASQSHSTFPAQRRVGTTEGRARSSDLSSSRGAEGPAGEDLYGPGSSAHRLARSPARSPAGKPVAAGGIRLECEAQGPTGTTG